MTVAPIQFTLADADRASDEWGCNCGPGALAATMGMTLDEVRPHMGDFERKRYTNPTLMLDALKSLGVRFTIKKQPCEGAGLWDFPFYGLCRVQWEGPWTGPNVPIRARYRYTHWVGACQPKHSNNIGIFDINCMNNGSGWCAFSDWTRVIVPHLLQSYPRASGQWHFTHVIEIERGSS